ncbi:NADPH-dependent F420 reductase [Kribbella lupini]|uniref:NADPH-dependent F420 reductase n=1 Tax=Kribbella lupini TaxID=291602 RepID=A0ABP4NKJ4_9ACTN
MMVKVTIVGAGNMGRAIGARLAGQENRLQVLAPTAEHATGLADELGDGVTGGGVDDTVEGEVVVLATPYDGALDFVAQRGNDLTGKVVVDITNPVDWASFDRLVTPSDSSAAQEIAARLPEGVPVVKAFNTTFAGTLSSGEVAGQQLDVLVAGDDQDAKEKVIRLVESAGLRAVDAGPLRRAQQLEHLGFLHMALQESLGSEYGSALKIVTP